MYKVPIVQSQDREKCPVGPDVCDCECVFASDYLCACVWEPHLSGAPEGSIERAIMSVYMPICVCECVKQI